MANIIFHARLGKELFVSEIVGGYLINKNNFYFYPIVM